MEKKQKTKKEKTASSESASDKLAAKATKKDFLVVGLGASAGGVKALQDFFAAMPPDSGMAFVAILHLSPEHESNLAQILQAQTGMKVTQVTETVKVEPNRVYVIPPNSQLEMVDGVIRPTAAERPSGHRIAIDVFFRTLADAYERNAVCVVLSGTGSDGTLGLKRVKESNGFAIVQDPEDAQYDSMPRSAINTQLADWILPVHQMPEKLIHFKESSERLHLTEPDTEAKKIAEEIHADESLREILTLLRVRTGHDFSNYKTPTLVRRIARHLQIHELEDIPSYLELLRNTPNELQSLLKNLLINVTNFFRDKDAFEALELEVVPNLFAGKTGKDTVRVWSAGCASGEEAFSLAMLLTEQADKLPDPPKIQVFASDVDDEAISEAREHRYPESIEADVSQERLKRFFTKEGAFYRVKKELRETVLFAPHNVLRDPPFSPLDLVSCRNLLIYLNRDTQERVLQIFHFALNSHGYLFLGSSETAENVATMFSPTNKKHRIYSRRNAPASQTSLPMMPVVGRWEVRLPERKTETPRERASTLSDIHYKLLENYAPSSVLVNQEFDIVYLSGSANKFLRFSGGEPSRNLLKAIIPDLLPDLRAALFSAQREHKSSEFPNIRVYIGGEETTVNLIVRAVDVQDETSDFLLVIFEEKNSPTVLKKADREIKNIADKDEAMETVVRRLEEDLQRTKEHLRSTIEQHETTVEELKASNEELQAINEELRSASEELETSKEELQSVNEELTTVNHELKDKIDETSRINSDLQNLMAATDIATIFLDKQLKIKRYTPPVEELFNITPGDIGRPLEHFTHRLRYENLSADAERSLRSLVTIEQEINDDKNRSYLSRFAPYRTIDDRIDGVVLNFIDITERKKAEATVRESEARLQKTISIETVGVLFFNNALEITDCNDAFVRMSGYTRSEIRQGKFSWEAFTPDGFIEASSRAIAEMLASGIATPYEKEYVRKDGSRFWALFAPKRISENEIVEFVTDITQQKRAEALVRESEEKYRTLFDSIDEGYALLEVIYDQAGEPVDLFYVETNAAFERINGFSGTGKKLSDVSGKLEPIWYETYDRVVKTGESTRVEYYAGITGAWYNVFCSRIGGEGSTRLVVVFDDTTERKQREQQQEFLLKLSDTLRPLSDANEIEISACRILGEQLKAHRVYYVEIFESEGAARVRKQYLRGDASSIAGEYTIEAFDWAAAPLRRGEVIVVTDVYHSDLVPPEYVPAMEAVQQTSIVLVPLIKEGEWVGVLTVGDNTTRDWKAMEVEMARETLERMWAVAARARAEEALRESDEQQAFLLKLTDALRPLSGAVEIKTMATRLLGEHLNVNRAFYADAENEHWLVAKGYEENIEPLPDVPFLMADFGQWIIEDFRAGIPLIVPDIRHEKRFKKSERDALAAIQIGAAAGVPLVKEKTLVAMLCLHTDAPRDWNEQEMWLLREVAERTWAAVERARAEQSLRDSEAAFRTISDAAPALAWVCDRNGENVYFNERWFDFTGQTEQDAAGYGWTAAMHPDDAKRILPYWERCQKTGEIYEGEVRYFRARDGEYRWHHFRALPRRNQAGEIEAWYGVSVDINDSKTIEEALRESEAKYRMLFDSMDEGFCTIEVLFNKRGKAVDYLFLNTNPAFERQTGLQNAVGKTILDLAPQHEKFWSEIYGEIAQTGEPKRFEHEAAALGRFYDVYAFRIGEPSENKVAVIFSDIAERKQAEQALAKSEEHYRAIVNQNLAGIFEIDLNGKIIFANDEFCRMLGYECGTLAELPLSDFIHSEDLPESLKKLERMQKNKKSFETEKRYVRRDGSIIWVHNSISPITNGDNRIHSAVIVSLNITERKKAELRLREAEERTRITLEAAELATWEWNIETGEVLWNEQHFRLFGMKPLKRPMKTEDYFRHVHPDHRELVAAELKKAVEQKVPFDVEFCAVLENGETRWMSGYGRVTEVDKKDKATRMSGVMFDITERKTAAEALRKSEEQLQLILESTREYSIITFNLKGTITRWNAGAERMFGYTESEMIGEKGDILFTTEDRAAGIPAQEFEVARKKGRAEDERWHLRKDGSRFFASGVMQPLKDGEIEGFVKIARDQTERLNVENTLREKQMLERLVTAQEGERKRIARDLHDELGQQLTALQMKLDAVRKAYPEPALLNQLNEIRDIARNLDEGVDFLAFELRPTVLNDFGLIAALDNYVKQWSRYSGVRAELTVLKLKKVRFKPEVETSLYRIVQEALNNTHKHAKATRVDIVLEKRGELLVLIVEDNGKGFNAKSKTSRRQGIGLIGINERVELIDGKVEIETAPKQGTTIYVRIPFSAAKEKESYDQ